MKMYNHLKHLSTLNKVYRPTLNILESHRNHSKSHNDKIPGKLPRDKSVKQVWRKRYPNAYLLINSTNIPFFLWFWPFDTLNAWRAIIGKKYPFYAFSWSRVHCRATAHHTATSHSRVAPPPPRGEKVCHFAPRPPPAPKQTPWRRPIDRPLPPYTKLPG